MGAHVFSDATDVCSCALTRTGLLLLCACIMRVVFFYFVRRRAPRRSGRVSEAAISQCSHRGRSGRPAATARLAFMLCCLSAIAHMCGMDEMHVLVCAAVLLCVWLVATCGVCACIFPCRLPRDAALLYIFCLRVHDHPWARACKAPSCDAPSCIEGALGGGLCPSCVEL